MVSCTRSSASLRLRVIRRAPPYSTSSNGTASRTNRAVNSASLSSDPVRSGTASNSDMSPNVRTWVGTVAILGGWD